MSNELLENNEELYMKQLVIDYDQTKNDLDRYIEIVGKWAETQTHFPENPSYVILRFVILFNKFRIDVAKHKLDMYYSMKGRFPELFFITPFCSEMQLQYKFGQLLPLPKVTDDFGRIIYHQLHPDYYDPKYFDFEKVMCQFIQLWEFLLHNDLCYKFHYIFDAAGFSVRHIASMNPFFLRKATTVLQKIYSNRMVSINIINVSPIMVMFSNNILKPLFTKKLKARFHVYSNKDELVNKFGKERMPKDIGGNEKSIQELHEMLMHEYEKSTMKNRFLNMKNLGVDESLRPKKAMDDKQLGFFGNLKKILVG